MGVKRNFVVILSKNEVVMMKKIIATRYRGHRIKSITKH